MLQEARCTQDELRDLATLSNAQVVFGTEVEGKVLFAAFAWRGELQRLGRSPHGCSHHFSWRIGHQCIRIRNACLQGGMQTEKDVLDQQLYEWLEQAAGKGEPPLKVGDFDATRDEVGAPANWQAGTSLGRTPSQLHAYQAVGGPGTSTGSGTTVQCS